MFVRSLIVVAQVVAMTMSGTWIPGVGASTFPTVENRVETLQNTPESRPSIVRATRPVAAGAPPRDRIIRSGPRRRKCPLGESVCEVRISGADKKFERCFNPTTHLCTDSLICPRVTPERCGDNCYSSNYMDANSMVCHNNSFLCPMDLPFLCGANSCYHPDEYKCIDGLLQDIAV